MKHIIEQRYNKDPLNDQDIAALLHLVAEMVKSEKPVERNGVYEFGRNGIVAIVRRRRENNQEKFVLTGFADWNKERELTDAIQTVIAKYGYTPEFSGFRNQVGAVISSLGNVSRESSIVKENALRQTPKEKAAEKLPEKSRGNDFSR